MRDRFFGGDPEGKLHLCMEFVGEPGAQVDDPWYTGDFTGVYKQISRACEGLITEILEKGNKKQ